MTSLIVLAFPFLLFSMQGSSINGEVLENEHEFDNAGDYLSFDGSDAIIDGQIQDELQDTEMLDRREVASLKCTTSSCTVCQGVYCLYLRYLPNENDFVVALIYVSSILYQEKIKAMDWDKCTQFQIEDKFSESCVRIENVRIDDSQACVDLTISSEFLTKSVSDVCM